MSYLLQTKEHVDLGNRYAETEDVIVSEDLRAVYRIHKDGSRRRIKDVGAVMHYVTMAKDYLAKEKQRKVEEAERVRVMADTLKEQPRPKLSPGVAALLIGGLAGLPGLRGKSPLDLLDLPKEIV